MDLDIYCKLEVRVTATKGRYIFRWLSAELLKQCMENSISIHVYSRKEDFPYINDALKKNNLSLKFKVFYAAIMMDVQLQLATSLSVYLVLISQKVHCQYMSVPHPPPLWPSRGYWLRV